MRIEHVHKYIRSKLGKKYIIFKCALPNCTHYVARNIVIGRKSLCWVCGNEFIMNVNTLLHKPHCKNCKRGRFTLKEYEEALKNVAMPATKNSSAKNDVFWTGMK